jgi:hypothetical protein
MKITVFLILAMFFLNNFSFSQVGKSHYKVIKSTETVDTCRCYIYDAEFKRYLYKIDSWDNYQWGDSLDLAKLFSAKQAEEYAMYFMKKDKKIWIGVKLKK